MSDTGNRRNLPALIALACLVAPPLAPPLAPQSAHAQSNAPDLSGVRVQDATGPLRELPLSADFCAIHRALSGSAPAQCPPPAPDGAPRAIVVKDGPTIAGSDPAAATTTAAATVTATVTAAGAGAAPLAATDPAQAARNALTGAHGPRARAAGAPRHASPYSARAVPAGDKALGDAGYFIHFAFDSDRIGADYAAHLDRLSAVLKTETMAATCLKVIGHTDAVGASAYNKTLSMRRAAQVRDHLTGKGAVPAGRVVVEARGEAAPIEGVDPRHPRNRRVEFLVRQGAGSCA